MRYIHTVNMYFFIIKQTTETPQLEDVSCYPAVSQQAHSLSQQQQAPASRLQPSIQTDGVDGPRRTESLASENSTLFLKHRRKDSAYKILVDTLGLITTVCIQKRISTHIFLSLRTLQKSLTKEQKHSIYSLLMKFLILLCNTVNLLPAASQFTKT